MTPGIQLIIGCALVSFGVSYAWWIKVRVWLLRQDLFEIRDRLWDEMRVQGKLEDPEHVRLRKSINSMIRMANWLSFWALLQVASQGVEPSPAYHSICAQKYGKLAMSRVIRYLLFETMGGWILSPIASLLMAMQSLREMLARWIQLAIPTATRIDLYAGQSDHATAGC